MNQINEVQGLVVNSRAVEAGFYRLSESLTCSRWDFFMAARAPSMS